MIAVGQILRPARLVRGLSLREVAARLGYSDVDRGIRRLSLVEATGLIREDLLARLLEVLGLDLVEFESAVEEAGRADEPFIVEQPPQSWTGSLWAGMTCPHPLAGRLGPVSDPSQPAHAGTLAGRHRLDRVRGRLGEVDHVERDQAAVQVQLADQRPLAHAAGPAEGVIHLHGPMPSRFCPATLT